jgi:hypothetical protein
MKGILESIPEFFQIVIALAIAIILIATTFYFFSTQTKGSNVEISGSVDQISTRLVDYVQNCWKDHRNGLDSQSAVCNIATIKISMPGRVDTVTEANVTKFLDCKTIPNNACLPDDCSKCTSSKYVEDQQDKIKWEFNNSTIYMQISYSGFDRVIEISNTYPSE